MDASNRFRLGALVIVIFLASLALHARQPNLAAWATVLLVAAITYLVILLRRQNGDHD